MEEITWINVDAVWFEVELFKVKDVRNPVEDLDAIQNTEHHLMNEMFPAGTARDAGYMAEALLTRDDGYNYALIYLCRYNSDPEISEGRDETGSVNVRTLIGDACSEEKAYGSDSDPKNQNMSGNEIGRLNRIVLRRVLNHRSRQYGQQRILLSNPDFT